MDDFFHFQTMFVNRNCIRDTKFSWLLTKYKLNKSTIYSLRTFSAFKKLKVKNWNYLIFEHSSGGLVTHRLGEIKWEKVMLRKYCFTRITSLRSISLLGSQPKVLKQQQGTLLLMINVMEVAPEWEHPMIPKPWAILEWSNVNKLFGIVGVAVD